MDPVTAALNLINTIAQIYLTTLSGMDAATREQYSKMALDDMQKWREMFAPIFEAFKPKKGNHDHVRHDVDAGTGTDQAAR
jgi:hypothetical protein